MRALYIYNSHSSNELSLIERVQDEMGSYVTIKSLEDCSIEIKNMVSSTPALLIVTDDLQGEGLTAEGVDGKLIVTAALYQRLDEEEKCVHNIDNKRLDCMIECEKAPLKEDADKWFGIAMRDKGWWG